MVSAFLHEVRAALVEKFVEVVETAPGERSCGDSVVAEAVDNVEATVLGCHLLGKYLDHVDVDAEPARGVAGGEHHRRR